MKTSILPLAFLLASLGLLPVQAQPPDDALQPHPFDSMRTNRPPPPPHVRRYFEVLKEKDPAEYERLTTLRENDPEAFRDELADRLRKERERRGWGGDRGEEGEHWHQRGPREERASGVFYRPRGGYSDGTPASPELEALEIKILNIARSLRDSQSDDERTRLRDELKAEIGTAFDLRLRLRQERLAQMEKRVEHLKGALQERQSKRDAIIQNRLDELTQDKPEPSP